MIAFVINYMSIWLPGQILLKSMVAKLIPANHQSFSHVLLSGVARLAMTIPAFTTVPLMPWVGNVVKLFVGRKALCNIVSRSDSS